MRCEQDCTDCAECRLKHVSDRRADLASLLATGQRQRLRGLHDHARWHARQIGELARQVKSLSSLTESAGGSLTAPASQSCSTGTCGLKQGDECENLADTYLAAAGLLKSLDRELFTTRQLKGLSIRAKSLGASVPESDLDATEKALEAAVADANATAGRAARAFIQGGCTTSWCPSNPGHPLCR